MAGTPDPFRQARRVLATVAALHKRGYERLRISPGMAPSGLYWRCLVTPASNTLASDGARVVAFEDSLVAFYTSGQGARLFDWEDASRLGTRRLADLFVERFPRIVDAAIGNDSVYLKWFEHVLVLANQDFFPIAYADWPLDEKGEWLALVGGDGREPPTRLRKPPPGEYPDHLASS